MKIYKGKQYLVFDYEDGRTVKYDFANNCSIGIKGKPVKGLNGQLRDLSIHEVIDNCTNKQYAKFLQYVAQRSRYPISNVGTLLSRVQYFSEYEQIFSAGFDGIIDFSRCHFNINDIPKSLIKLAQKYPIKLNDCLVRYYSENTDAHYIAFSLDYISLNNEDILDIWRSYKYNYHGNDESYFNILVNDFGYNAKDLYLYLDRLKTFEALERLNKVVAELYDYANMMRQISPKYDKYPCHFLTSHAIASRNFQRLQKQFSEDQFKKRITKEYEISVGDYVFIYPKSTQDIKDEAVQQTNCVSSYIDRVIDGQCHILFLRKKSNPEKSLVTIEVVNGKIVQAYRRFNNPITEEDQVAIDTFNKKFAKKERKIA